MYEEPLAQHALKMA